MLPCLLPNVHPVVTHGNHFALVNGDHSFRVLLQQFRQHLLKCQMLPFNGLCLILTTLAGHFFVTPTLKNDELGH